MRKLTALAAILAVFLGAWLLLSSRARRVETFRPLAGRNPGEIRKILLERAGDSIILERQNGVWSLTSPVKDRAEQGAAEALASGLRELAVGTEVASGLDSYASYGLQESSASHVRVFGSQAAPALDGFFGGQALGYDSLYFRFAKDKPVYLTTGLGGYHLNKPADAFRDRSLASMPEGSIKSIRSSKGKFPDLKKAEEALLALRFAEFADQAPASLTGLDSGLILELQGELRSETIVFGRARPEKSGPPRLRFARSEKRGVTGLVPAADAEAVLTLLK